MQTIRHLAFLAGVMGAEEAEVPPDALAAATAAVTTGVLTLPDGSRARLRFENEGHWFATDWQGKAALSTLHRGPQDDSWTTELIAQHLQRDAHLEMAAVTAGLRLAPIVVTAIDYPDAHSGKLADIAGWIGLALLQRDPIYRQGYLDALMDARDQFDRRALGDVISYYRWLDEQTEHLKNRNREEGQ